MAIIARYQNPDGEIIEARLEIPETYMVIYGSGWISPTHKGGASDVGDSFEKAAEARNKINRREHPNGNHIIAYCPTDIEFFETISIYINIKRLDIYSHGFAHGLNLGGFIKERMVGEKNMNSAAFDWNSKIVVDNGRDLRRVDIHEDVYFPGAKTKEPNELVNLKSSGFSNSVKVYFWGCNIGGQLTPNGVHVLDNTARDSNGKLLSPKGCFAQKFAEHIGKGEVYALVGKGATGGSEFKTDENGKPVFDDGEMIPANISLNHNRMNTRKLSAYDYMIKFPIE